MVRLRQKCGTKLSIPNVEQLGSITICFQNCRSLQKHIEDIRKDRSPRLIYWDCVKHEFYKTNSYNLDMYNSFFVSEKCPNGMAVYSKCNVASLSGHCIAGVELTLMQVQHINIIFMYFPSKSATLKVCKDLSKEQ